MVYQANIAVNSIVTLSLIKAALHCITFLNGLHKDRAWGNILKTGGTWGVKLYSHARTFKGYLISRKRRLTEGLKVKKKKKSRSGETQENFSSRFIRKLPSGNVPFTNLM